MSYKPQNLLVTGGAGFIGANFVQYWLDKYPGNSLVVLDLLTYAGNRESLKPVEENERFTFVLGDICDYQLVTDLIDKHCIDTIVHFAAESHVDRSIAGADEFIRSNILGTFNLLKVAKEQWLDNARGVQEHRFHHVSTDEVYGTLEAGDPPFSETNQYLPNSPYSASKASSDHLVRSYHHTYGLNTIITNCSNNYGPYQFPEKLIPLCILNSLHGEPLPIYGDGKQIRDWLYVEDHARGIDLALTRGKAGEVYNIGGINEWANIDIVRLICKKLDEKFEQRDELKELYPQCPAAIGKPVEGLITYVADRPGHDRRYAIDPAKSNDELDYQPHESFETGIDKTVDWYLDSVDWWKPLK